MKRAVVGVGLAAALIAAAVSIWLAQTTVAEPVVLLSKADGVPHQAVMQIKEHAAGRYGAACRTSTDLSGFDGPVEIERIGSAILAVYASVPEGAARGSADGRDYEVRWKVDRKGFVGRCEVRTWPSLTR